MDDTAGSDENRPAGRPVERNIAALMERRRKEIAKAGFAGSFAAAITGFAGTIWSVFIHALVFGLWIVLNVGVVPQVSPWDPSLVVLAMAASVESIFLTTFVLMNQNRLARMDDRRAELTLQIGLLSEHEMTKIAQLVSAIAQHLDVPSPPPEELDVVIREIRPEAVLDEIARSEGD
jgi:uncharacterized membrane protein